MNRLFFLLLLAHGACLSAFAGKATGFPKYREVTAHFFRLYTIKDMPENAAIKFEKRPNGWHAVIHDYTKGDTILRDGLIWSQATASFPDVDFTKRPDGEPLQGDEKALLNAWEAAHFDACPYFGYAGWDRDVIRDYENTDGLGDTTLYGVGRAYASFASNLLNNNSGLSDPGQRFVLKEGKNALSPEQLEKYRYYHRKAIEIFKKVKASDPGFETLVGSIGTKLSNEYVTAFLELRLYQNEEEALKELPDNAYSDFYVSVAENFLSTCSKDAILFVNGDTDTYPLLYVQAKNHFRPDVMVVNISLLQMPLYVNHLRGKILDAEGISFTLDSAAVNDVRRDVIYIQKDSAKTWELDKALRFIKDDSHMMEVSGAKYFYLDGNDFTTSIRHKTIHWQLPSDAYFLKNTLMQLDILASCGNSRSLYFALTVGEDGYIGLSPYFSLEGGAYLLDHKKLADANDTRVNSAVLYKNLMSAFSWKGTEAIREPERIFVDHYIVQFYWLSRRLKEDKQALKAREVLNRFFEVFPNDVMPYDRQVLCLMGLYYTLGETTRANAIGKKVIMNIKQKRVHISGPFDTYNSQDKNRAALEEIRSMAESYGQEVFFKPLLDES